MGNFSPMKNIMSRNRRARWHKTSMWYRH